MKDVAKLWNERSSKYGKALEGVLPKSFPRFINQYLDEWMYGRVKEVVDSGRSLKILDLGCGYGRVSGRLLRDFPYVTTLGIDLADKYVDIYNNELAPRGKALKGDIRSLPFRNSGFDVVFMVTTLMYLTQPNDQKQSMKELFRVLKPGGKFVIIERNPIGHNIITLGGLVTRLRGKKFQEIPSVGFRKDYMLALIRNAGGVTTGLWGLPFLTLSLPWLILLSMVNNTFLQKIFGIVVAVDRRLGWFLTPSLYIAYIGAKREKN